MLRSRTVGDRLIARFDLRKVYHTRYREDARKKLAQCTMISQDRKSGVLTITVTDHDPHRAFQIAQAYVEELDRIANDVSTSAAHRERLFIEQRLKTVKQDLDAASLQFSEYSSKNATLDLKEQGRATVEAAAVLEGQLIAAESELQGLEQIYTESNVRVRALRARVNELQRQLDKVGGSSAKSAPGDLNGNSDFPSIRQLPLLGVRWADLYRETKVQETLYELLSEQFEQTKIEEAKETPVVKVLDAAAIPEKKSGPSRILIILVGVMTGLIAGVVQVVGVETWKGIDPNNSYKRLLQEIGIRCSARWKKVSDTWRQRRRVEPSLPADPNA
jgi:capsule polysaccharide export protein KpsE/RkpR